MRLETIDQQILPVLRLFWDRQARGEPLREALRDAAREVATDVNVAHQTVVDGFTRRLQLATIDQLYALLKLWTEGDPRSLASQLKVSSDRSAHASIDTFFESSTGTGKAKRQAGVHATSEPKLERFFFDLRQDEARMLRTIAEIDGVSTEEFVVLAIRAQLAARMKAAAQDLMR